MLGSTRPAELARDSRGVGRLYAVIFTDGEWRLLRVEPDYSPLPFRQRFTDRFGDDGGTIRGTWETSTWWEGDFDLTYRRSR